MSNHELHLPLTDTQSLQSDCYADRATIGKIERQEGEIVQIDIVNFGIQYKGSNPVLLPCNLPEDFEQTGMKIIFSGLIKEIRLTEFLAGQPIALTHLEKLS